MKFPALLPISVMLLLLPSCCMFRCQNEGSSCYRKGCSTTSCTTPTYRSEQQPSSSAQETVIEETAEPFIQSSQGGLTAAEVISENLSEPEAEEVNEEDESMLDEEIERETPRSFSTDKEALDDETLEEK